MTKNIASAKQVSEAVSFVLAAHDFSRKSDLDNVGFCNHCDNFCALSDGFCFDCTLAFALGAAGLRRPTGVEAEAALRADVLARLAQESAAGFGV